MRLFVGDWIGTGKSKVIQTVTDFFAEKDCLVLLIKSAYTGIAASIINGKTTHTIGKISLNENNKLSDEAKDWLHHFWKFIKYLILGKSSMLARSFLAKLEQHISIAKGFDGNNGAGLPFGGVNVILCGDFHQFPPVAAKKTAPLYYLLFNPEYDAVKEQNGRKIYEQFQIVVLLEEQVQVTGSVWLEFLQHLRYGNVKEHHISMLKGLVLSNPQCPPTDFSSAPRNNASLVTPRHIIRSRWNAAMVRKHCKGTKSTLFICPAHDTINKRALTLAERYAVATRQERKQKGQGTKNGLPDKIELALGMKVMVTKNLDTGLDIANGARGEIVSIILDPQETSTANQPVVELEYLPAYILVKLQRTRAGQLEGLKEGILPIEPAKRTFEIQVSVDGKRRQKMVTRIQLPLTAAYAFMDYRSQGQTIPCIIVDIAPPSSGGPPDIIQLICCTISKFRTIHDPSAL